MVPEKLRQLLPEKSMNECSKAQNDKGPLSVFHPQVVIHQSMEGIGRKVGRSSWRQRCFSGSIPALPGEVSKCSHVQLIKPPAGLNVALEIEDQFPRHHLWVSLTLSMLSVQLECILNHFKMLEEEVCMLNV